ncbi:MAG: HlyD family efflux transporter periplasmic adaptor subunit [Oscillospiraceae bacterium]|nr:HlyD family efflux transporter periplasmic adaptor subunit [Oscillospiraceae bacterium]
MSVLVRPGSVLKIGDAVATYKTGSGDVKTLYSNHVGTVSENLVKAQDTVVQGSEVVRLSPKVDDDQVIVCYVNLQDAKKLERGMIAYVYLSSADKQTYGHMEARVINIDSYAASAKGMSYVIGSDNNLSSHFTKDGAVVAVTCELYPDPNTTSGFYWSNDKGGSLTVTNGSLVSAKVIVEEIPPISKMFAKIQEIWGGN